MKRNTVDKCHDVKNDVKNKNRTEKGFRAKRSEALKSLWCRRPDSNRHVGNYA
nr:MAG TPA: hypothetical protein [Caudoviricetes sp.]